MIDDDEKSFKSLLDKLKADSNILFIGNEEVIKSKHDAIKELLSIARKEYFQGNFPKAAKYFRQLAKTLNEFHFKIEKKGNYDARNILNDLTGKEWLRHTKSWIIFDGKPSEIPKEIKDHPASFPPDLIEYFIEFFTKKGGWVLDPFMGIGSTAVACQNTERNCWGTEINPKYCHYAIKRVKVRDTSLTEFLDVKNGDAQKKDNLVSKIFNRDCRALLEINKENNFPPMDFCITSPPYWNILETSRGGVKSTHKKRIEEGLDEKYSDNPNDIGNVTSFEKYLEIMEGIFTDVLQLLKAGGYLMIIIQNIRPQDGVMMPIAWDLAKLLSKTYILRQEFIWLQNQKQLGIWGYPKTYVSNVHHHYCLVLQKSLEKEF